MGGALCFFVPNFGEPKLKPDCVDRVFPILFFLRMNREECTPCIYFVKTVASFFVLFRVAIFRGAGIFLAGISMCSSADQCPPPKINSADSVEKIVMWE